MRWAAIDRWDAPREILFHHEENLRSRFEIPFVMNSLTTQDPVTSMHPSWVMVGASVLGGSVVVIATLSLWAPGLIFTLGQAFC